MKKRCIVVVVCLFLFFCVGIESGRAVDLPNASIKTVEFFINQSSGEFFGEKRPQLIPFSFYIPEDDPVLRYAWVEIRGLYNQGPDMFVDSGRGARFKYGMPDVAADSRPFLINYPFSEKLKKGVNGPFTLNFSMTGSTANNLNGLSAKLILTYEYNVSSPRQLKTARYFVGQNESVSVSRGETHMPFAIVVPESGDIRVHSAFLEFEGAYSNPTTVRNTTLTFGISTVPSALTPKINNLSIKLGNPGTDTARHSFYFLYNASRLYNITFNSTTQYTAFMDLSNVSFMGARAVITYEFDNSSRNQQKTVRYLLLSHNKSNIAPANVTTNFVVPIAEENIKVQSAYIQIRGINMSATPISVGVGGGNGKKFNSQSTNVEGTSEFTWFTLLYNATELYAMGGGVNGPYQLNVSFGGYLLMAELFVTYNYSSSERNQLKTIEFAPYWDVDSLNQPFSSGGDIEFFGYFPEFNSTVKSFYAESFAMTETESLHRVLLGGVVRHYAYLNTNTGDGVAYLLQNASEEMYVNATQGVNGPYLFAREFQNSAGGISMGKMIATYAHTVNVTSSPAGVSVGTLNGSLIAPTSFSVNSQPQNETFLIRANITCIGAGGNSCGSVNGSLWYNATNAVPNVPNNITLGSGLRMQPFYTIENNSWICGTMVVGDRCNITWTVNTTGVIGTTWKLGVNFTSDNGAILSNVTNYTEINIIDSTLSITLSNNLTDVKFGASLDPGTTNNPALGNDPSLYNITCGYSGGCNISIKAGHFDFVQTSGSSTFRVENVSWNSPGNTTALVRRLNDTWPGVINASLADLAVQRIFFWIDIPAAQTSAQYLGNF